MYIYNPCNLLISDCKLPYLCFKHSVRMEQEIVTVEKIWKSIKISRINVLLKARRSVTKMVPTIDLAIQCNSIARAQNDFI
ncbi:uncharacterized protein LOC112495330 isoform X2 [Cephus cinctus]|uniref:Uncharacterized protein LOC112495330 isoform X2 n=1 Tax=Cephus cinctus TaxID=211228 RepID=A0AAJ7RU37_CEPCN|nr:uncharacterized protein LOC112495330 isoform X2 [Cephus cinctus]